MSKFYNNSYVIREEYLSIDSSDRNRELDPNTHTYTIHLRPSDTTTTGHAHNTFKNIIGIQLMGAKIPNTNNVLNEQYLLLVVEQLRGPYDATNTPTRKALAKLEPGFVSPGGNFVEAAINGIEYIGRYQVDSDVTGVLDKLTFQFQKYDGTPFVFGADNALPADPNPLLQNTIDLKLLILEPNTAVLGHQLR